MGTSFVTLSHEISGPGFWMRDGMLELWLRLLALHLPDASEGAGTDDVTIALREQWLVASRGVFGGCVPHGLEDACASVEGRRVVEAAVRSLLKALERGSAALDGHTLNLLGRAEGNLWGTIDRAWLRDIGRAWLDLLEGRIHDGPSSTDIMPGSKPYRREEGS